MKILAGGPSGYIVQMEHHEIASILGVTYSSQVDEMLKSLPNIPRAEYGRPTLLGAVIDVSQRFNRMVEIERGYGDLVTKANHLQALADLLRAVGTPAITMAEPAKEPTT